MSILLDARRYARQLQDTILFDGVDFYVIRDWLAQDGAEVVICAADELLFACGEKQHKLGIVLRGYATVERKFADGRMHMSELKKNDLYGAASLFGGDEGFVLNIRAQEDCRVLLISEESLLNLFREQEQVLRNYLRYLNTRIRFLNQRLDAFSKNTVAARVYSLLSMDAVNGVCEVHSFTTLSETLCISRATLYRALDTLSADGRILRDGKKIILLEEQV